MKRIIALAISLTAAVIMIAFMARVLPSGAASILLDINRESWPFTVQNVLWLAFFAGLGELSIRWHAGRIEEVLAEGINAKDPQQLMGRTRTNRLTFFNAEGPDGRRYSAGDLVKVRIDAVRSFSLTGNPLPSSEQR